MDTSFAAPLRRQIFRLASDWFRGWRGPAIGAGAVAIAGLWLGWPWLVAAGVAPIILTFAPCAVMCALGMCMSRTRASSDPA